MTRLSELQVLGPEQTGENWPAKPRLSSDPVLSEAEIREALEALCCPWCGAGPFRMVSAHIYPRHGITARQVRDAAGLTLRHSLTSADVRRQRTAEALKHPVPPPRPGVPQGPKRQGKARMRSQRANQQRILGTPELNERRLAGLRRRVAERMADPHEREKMQAQARRALAVKAEHVAAARTPRYCVNCGTEVPLRQRASQTPRTCSPECRMARMRIGLRAGWEARRA